MAAWEARLFIKFKDKEALIDELNTLFHINAAKPAEAVKKKILYIFSIHSNILYCLFEIKYFYFQKNHFPFCFVV